MSRIGPSGQHAGFNGRRFAIASSALIACYVPWLPNAPTSTLDSGWMLALGIAYERGFSFGRDLVFTYGPYGFLSTWQYSPATYNFSLIFWAFYALCVASLNQEQRVASPAIGLVALAWLAVTPDTALLALPTVYVVANYDGARPSWRSFAAAVVMGTLPLIKFTLMPVCALAIVLGAIGRRQFVIRDMIRDVSGFVVSFLAAWIAIGQPALLLGNYLRYSAEVAAGYPGAMAWPTLVSAFSFSWLLLFATSAVCVAALCSVWSAAFERHRGIAGRLAFAAFFAALLWIVVKQSTTRADVLHLRVAVVYAGALALLVPSPRARWASYGVAILCAVLTLKAFGTISRYYDPRDDAPRAQFARTMTFARGWLGGASIRGQLDLATLEARARVEAEDVPRPPAGATFDIVGYEQYLLQALSPTEWRPKPVLQSYAAYSQTLSNLSKEFLSGAMAPEWLLLNVQTIDQRWPLADDPLLWGTVKRHYRPYERRGARLLARRRESAYEVRQPAVSRRLSVDDWTRLPDDSPGDVYARILVTRSTAERLRGVLLKPATHHLEVRLHDCDDVGRFRLVDGVASTSGFLLSPAILDSAALEHWMSGSTSLPRVVAMRVVDDRGRAASAVVDLGGSPH